MVKDIIELETIKNYPPSVAAEPAEDDRELPDIEGDLEAIYEEEIANNNPRIPQTWKLGCFMNECGCMMEGKYNIEGKEITTKICDGYVYIDKVIESKGDNINKMVLKVKPLHGIEREIEIDAKDLADNRKINGILCNIFGTDDLSNLRVKHIKEISDHPWRVINLYKIPQWYGNEIIAPGIGNKNNIFKFEKNVVVDFHTDGSYQFGIRAFEYIMKGFNPKHAIIGIVTFLGAPVIGKLWEGDRFVFFLQATTGFFKTAFVMLLASLYGQGYNQESNLLRWGQGTTINAANHVAAMSGPFPFILDNYKAYKKEDPIEITKLIHGVLEGSEKARMNKDSSDLRDSAPYICTPIITGENYPGNDAAARARSVILKCEKPRDLDAVTEAQKHIADINALGKQWVLWISSDEGQLMLEFIADNFDLKRKEYLKKIKDSVNVGRIATNAAILYLIYELMKFCPYTRDFASKYEEDMMQAINDHIIESSEEVNNDTDAEKFISWLRAAIETNQFFISGIAKCEFSIDKVAEANKAAIKIHIGSCKDDEILITPEVLNNVLLPAYLKTNSGIQVDKTSLRRQLHERGFILRDEKNNKYTMAKYIDGKTKKVMVFKKHMLYPEE